MLRTIIIAAVAVGAAASGGMSARADVCGAVAGNLVTNCGFETGNLTGWTLTPSTTGSFQFVTNVVKNSGNSSWLMAAGADVPDVISQVLTTTPGATYEVQFYYNSLGSVPSGFIASWDGTPLLTLTNPSAASFAIYSFLVTGTGSDTLSLGGYNQPSADALDDVSVRLVADAPAQTPEPASMLLLGAGLAGIGLMRRCPVVKQQASSL